MNKKYDKKKLYSLIARNINFSIHKLHIISIIGILIDELSKDLLLGNKINIPNFGILRLNDIKTKKIISILTKEIRFTKRTKALRLKLTKKISKYLLVKSLEDMKIR